MSRLSLHLRRLWPRRVRTQLIVGIALVHLVLMTVFVVDVVARQRRFLREQSLAQTGALAATLAVNSTSWVLANDVVGLEEIVEGLRKYPWILEAMVLSPDGLVLAHTIKDRVGLYVTDGRSRAVLGSEREERVVAFEPDALDVAVSIRTRDGAPIGWVRVRSDHGHIARSLRSLARNGVLYVLAAMLGGSIFAVLIGNRLTAGLSRLVALFAQIRDGRRDVRAPVEGVTEVAELGRGTNEMLDALGTGEKLLRRSEARFRETLDGMLEGCMIIGFDWTYLYVNEAAARHGHLPGEDLVGRTMLELYPGAEETEVFRHYRRCMDERAPERFDAEFVFPDGSASWYEFSVTPVPEGIFVLSLDVTERRQAAQRLTEQSRLLESFFQHSHTGLVLLDRDFNFLRVNDAYAKACQREPSAFVDKNHFDLYPSEELEAKFREVVRTGVLFRAEGRPFSFPDHPERGVTYWDLAVAPIRGSGGEVEFVVFSLSDVTERKTAEDERRRAALYARSLIEASLDPLVTISPTGKITDVSSATEAVTGLNRADLVGSDFSDYFTEPDKAREGYQKVLAEGTVRDYPLTIRHTSGRTTDVLYNATVYRNASGELQGVFAAARDITELERAQGEIRRLNEDLERRILERTADLEAANHELEAFSYSVSHDLRAPLRAIDGFSRIILDEFAPHLPPECRGHLAVVCQNAQQMGRLIDDLLAFSRLGRQPLTRQTTLPAELVETCLAELQPEVEGRRVETTIGDLPACQADPALLKQVWINLLSNALKFTRRREVARIEIGSRENDGQQSYYVKDNGVGFDMRYVGKLFGVFQRLHRAEDYEGTGVGLAIVQRIVRRHGGTAWAEAEVDRGATFHFTLESEASP